MKIVKTGMLLKEIATRYFELTESILGAMIASTLGKNLPVVFVLNRPLFHACYKGMWVCLVENPTEVPDELFKLGTEIDAVIETKFESWNAPFSNKRVSARYSAFLKSPVMTQMSEARNVRPSTLIERLHDDVHGGLPSLEYYERLAKDGMLLNATKELCVIGHDPLYLNLRFAMAMRFPDGPVNRSNLLAEPFGEQIFAIYRLLE